MRRVIGTTICGALAWLVAARCCPGDATTGGPTTAPVYPTDVTVAADGSAAFKSIQEAVDALRAYPLEDCTVHVRPGTYRERVEVPRVKPHVHFKGDDAATTIITCDTGATMPGANGKPIGTFATATVRVLADDFSAEGITFENTFGNHGQALAVEIAGDRVAFDRCRFLGWQDTVFADSDGRNYFHDCLIAGHVDFIFGKSTAVFDHCEIRSRAGGYLTAASTGRRVPFGYVFLDCRLTAEPGVKKGSVYLGRPWRPYGATAFVRCEMGDHVQPVGWSNWKQPANEKTARYAEYGSTGPGGNASQRVGWAKQLTAADANRYTVPQILSGADGWTPLGFRPQAQR